eukprot:scaffold447_cov384-Prasinococcus_capsulatus_cf.AAC.8
MLLSALGGGGGDDKVMLVLSSLARTQPGPPYSAPQTAASDDARAKRPPAHEGTTGRMGVGRTVAPALVVLEPAAARSGATASPGG